MWRWLRPIKWWCQRRIRGFDDRDAWHLSRTVAAFVLPRLKVFRAKTISMPYIDDKYTEKDWHEELDVMIEAFEYIVSDDDDIVHLPQAEYNAEAQRRDEIKWLGTNVFGRRFLSLWD